MLGLFSAANVGFGRMRGLKIIVPVLLLLFIIIFLLARVPPDTRTPPSFVQMTAQPTNAFQSVHYGWGDTAPFQSGKIWLWTISTSTNPSVRTYLYDLDHEKVLGQLTNRWAVFSNGDGTRVLCGHARSREMLWQKFVMWLGKLTKKNFTFRPSQVETFWVLDLRDNSAKRIGELSQFPARGSVWRPAPGFRYGYNVPSNAEHWTFALCDLEEKTMTTLKVRGDLRGWWDDENIIVEDGINSFVLFNITTRKTAPLFSAAMIEQFLSQAGLTNDPSGLHVFSTWNGGTNDICLAPKFAFFKSLDGFVLKVDRASRTLRVQHRNFKFEHLGHINAEGTHYLYSGESGETGRGGNGGVILRDLAINVNRTLVVPDHGGRYALPRFYGNSVIYFRNRLLWRVDLNGSNNAPLFPAGETRDEQ